MADLEKIISSNRNVYDSDEPGDGHFERFQKKLSELHQENISHQTKVVPLFNRNWLRIAAAVVILMGFGFVLFNYVINDNAEIITAQDIQIDLSPELNEIEIYYSSLTDERFNIIDRLVPDTMEGMKIKDMVEMELSELNENYGELLQEYKNNPDDDRIIDAIINNYRIQAEILDNIIIKHYELKKQKNETQENESVNL